VQEQNIIYQIVFNELLNKLHKLVLNYFAKEIIRKAVTDNKKHCKCEATMCLPYHKIVGKQLAFKCDMIFIMKSLNKHVDIYN